MDPSERTHAVLESLEVEGYTNEGRAEARASPSPVSPKEEPARSSDADRIGTGMPIPKGDAAEDANGNQAHPANGAAAFEPQAAAAPLDPAPSGSLGRLSEGQPQADTSGQAPLEGYRGDEQAASDGAPSGTSGGSRPRHHLLRHTLPPELSGLNCVHHFGVDGVAPALRLVQTMSQRELQQAFEKVYNVKSSSNNNNWLRKKLVEALVPRESSNDPEVDSILEELASRSGARKRQKEWTSAASGGIDGWRGHHMPPQLNPYAPYPTAALAAAQAAQAAAAATAPTNQRKSSKVRPSPTDADAGYTGEDWGAPVEEVTAAGRKKRRAAAGVAAATAAVLRDPALEEIEKADLRRAAMGDYERRWGTGNPGYGGRGGRGGYHGSRGRADRDGRDAVGGQGGQQDVAKTLQNLTHLLSIAVQQGKLGPSAGAAPGGWAGAGAGAPGGLGALGALAAQAMQAQYGQQHYGQPAPQQQYDYAAQQQQQQQQAGGAPPSLAGVLAALIQQQQQQQQGAGHQQNGWATGFGGAPAPPAPAAPAPPPAEQQSVLARLLKSMAQDPSRTPEQLQQLRAMAAQVSAGAAAPAPAPAPAPGPPAADPQHATATATLQQVLAARIAQLRSAGPDGQHPAGDLPRQGSSDVPPTTAATTAAAGTSGGTSIPGSNYPVDTMLMQLLQQQQQQAQRTADDPKNGNQS